MIQFNKREEKTLFCFPGEDRRRTCVTEYRIDPLTGRTSVICDSLLKKYAVLYGQSDIQFINNLVEESRQNCFFCAPTVYTATPEYPECLCPTGRLEKESAILFPNLFPTAAVHAVLTWPDYHYLTPDQFSPILLQDAFELTSQFAESVNKNIPDISFLSLNCNYMPPAGGSIIHPHLQIVGTAKPPYFPHQTIQAADKWYNNTKTNYWDALCKAEQNTEKRWISKFGTWSWIAPWCPMGANEIMGIHESAATIYDLNESDWNELANGVHKVLSYYSEKDCSSFNFFLCGGTKKDRNGQRCVMRMITRQNLRPGYRNDEYFLQKFHGIELIVRTPELLADDLSERFQQ